MVTVATVELTDEVEPLALAARNLVEVLLHLRRERDVDEVAEVPAEQARHRKRREAGNQRLALAEHIAAPLDRPNRRGVGRRPADAETLERSEERRVGKGG